LSVKKHRKEISPKKEPFKKSLLFLHSKLSVKKHRKEISPKKEPFKKGFTQKSLLKKALPKRAF
jgi:hypothetical protein